MLKLNKPYFLLLIYFLIPFSARAEFNPNSIITDNEANNYGSMTQVQIRDFLQSHNSFLATYFYEGNNPGPGEVTLDPTVEYFKQRSAAEIIWNAAQEAKINPQFILTTLQKEMSLIEDPDPVENAVAYAMGYGCPDSGGCNFKFKGFGKQVRSASLQFRYYMDNITEYKHRPGERSCVDDYNPFIPCTSKGTEIKPENNITAAMYVYTPHISGNKSFRDIWERYGFSAAAINTVTDEGIIPEGALVKAKDGEDIKSIYLIHASSKLPFATMNALVSRFDPAKVLAVSSTELDKYPTGPVIKFSNYTILSSADGQKYLVDGLTKRLISSAEAFKKLGFNPEEVISATADELATLTDGEPIESVTTQVSPFGKLFRDLTTKSLYYVKDGQKSPIIDELIAKANFPALKINSASSKTLATYTDAPPVKLSDGTLIKKEKDPNVYVISAGRRRLIPDARTFNDLGYNWKNILTVSAMVINFHIVGQPLSPVN
ncbi:MAG: hypothetical protein C3F02_04580 [Parcubacteria group bacterium]|nr:MAG: hypothetical protein C3F02_04580 [Parcubacteria group bacterium]